MERCRLCDAKALYRLTPIDGLTPAVPLCAEHAHTHSLSLAMRRQAARRVDRARALA